MRFRIIVEVEAETDRMIPAVVDYIESAGIRNGTITSAWWEHVTEPATEVDA